MTNCLGSVLANGAFIDEGIGVWVHCISAVPDNAITNSFNALNLSMRVNVICFNRSEVPGHPQTRDDRKLIDYFTGDPVPVKNILPVINIHQAEIDIDLGVF